MVTDAAAPGTAARRAGMPQGMDRALVRVRSVQGDIVGTGFLVDARHVVTCTHVVLRALGRADRDTVGEGDTVTVDFPLVDRDVLVRADVAVAHALTHRDHGDVAVLSLNGELPTDLRPVRLVVADDLWGHPFRAFGFPRRLDQGVWAAGVLRAPQGTGWVQMEGGASGYAVEAGFSGGAVWDDELAGVVGMTVAADGRPDLRAAFLIPSSTLIQAWPELVEGALPPCPYRGLHPFRSSDTAQFFGREDVTERLVREAVRRPLLAVVGPSGSGKSSVVFAGVVPRLGRERGWTSVTMRPAQASSPLFALAAALVPALEPGLGETERLSAANALVTVLRDGRLSDVVGSLLARAQLDHLLLVVDQMEELFARDHTEIQEFTHALLAGVSPDRSLTVLLTLRADFLGNALQNPGLAEALEDSVITIGQMGREQLRAVIEGPLPPEVRYEAGLVERILGDIGDEPGSLPLLEFALTLLWERQQSGLLAHSAYQELGGVHGALASYAERVYSDQLLPEDQEEARRLFVQLVRPTDVGASVRRVARRSDLGEGRWQLGQRLAATRLLVADRDAAGAESVELVHEALIDGWARLHHWTRADQAFRAWQEQVRAAAATWEGVRRDAGGLLRGAPLAEAEKWLQERPDDLGDTERQFIRASQVRRGRSVRRLRMAVAGLTVLLLVMTGLGGLAVWQSNRVADQVRLAASRSLISQAQQLSASQLDVAMLLAVAAYRMTGTPDSAGAVTRMATGQRQVDRVLATDGPVVRVDADPADPNRIVLYGSDAIRIWDIERGTAIRRWESEGLIGSTARSSDGKVFAVQESGPGSGGLVLWYPAEDRTVPVLDADTGYYPSDLRLVFSPDGVLLAVCNPEQIQLWETGTLRLRATIDNSTSCDIGFTDRNKFLHTDGNDFVLRDTDENGTTDRVAVTSPATGSAEAVNTFRLSVAPNGRSALVEDNGGKKAVWDLDRLTPLGDIGADIFGDIAWTHDGRWAVIGDQDGGVLVDMTSRTKVKTYDWNDGSMSGYLGQYFYGVAPFALGPDGRRIVVPTGGNAVALIETNAVGDVPAGQVYQMALTAASGNRFVSLTFYGEVAVHNGAASGPTVVVPGWPADKYVEVLPALSPDGRHSAAPGERPDEVVLHDVTGPGLSAVPLAGGSGEVTVLAFDDGAGRFLAAAGTEAVSVWSVDDAVLTSRVPLVDGRRATGVAVSGDGSLVAVVDPEGAVYLAETASGRTQTLPMRGVRAVSFSPDGRWLSASTDSDIRLWEVLQRRELPVRLPAVTTFGSTTAATFSRDGTYVAASRSLDGYPRTSVWQVDDGKLVGEVAGYHADVAFLPDGRHLAIAGTGLFVTDFEPASAVGLICRVVGRDLTGEEWNQYAQELDRVAACP